MRKELNTVSPEALALLKQHKHLAELLAQALQERGFKLRRAYALGAVAAMYGTDWNVLHAQPDLPRLPRPSDLLALQDKLETYHVPHNDIAFLCHSLAAQGEPTELTAPAGEAASLDGHLVTEEDVLNAQAVSHTLKVIFGDPQQQRLKIQESLRVGIDIKGVFGDYQQLLKTTREISPLMKMVEQQNRSMYMTQPWANLARMKCPTMFDRLFEATKFTGIAAISRLEVSAVSHLSQQQRRWDTQLSLGLRPSVMQRHFDLLDRLYNPPALRLADKVLGRFPNKTED